MADGEVRGQVLRVLRVVLGAAAQTHHRRQIEHYEAEEEREEGRQGQDIAAGRAAARRGKSGNVDSHPRSRSLGHLLVLMVFLF